MYKFISILLISWLKFINSQNDVYGNTYSFNDNDGVPKNFKREHSLVKPYQGNWDLLGNTLITSSYVRLTSDKPSMQGAIWNKIPCDVKFWEMQIHFRVHGHGKDLFGDGFVFWYVKDPMQKGEVYGSRDYFTGLAIIADTYSNQNGPHNHVHPYISAMVNNGTLHYDHDRDGTHTQLSGCSAKFRNSIHDTLMVVSYNNDVLRVFTIIEGNNEWKECFTVNGVILPTGYYFGLSAVTGGLSDNHDVIAMRLYDLTLSSATAGDRSNLSPSASYFEAPRDHADDPRPSTLTTWKKIFLLIFGVLSICGCVFIGGMFYSKQQEQQRKRFY